MCGILTAIGTSLSSETRARLGSNLKILNHRGPDNLDAYSDDKCFLGHTRLSIVDTSSAAHQPYVFEDLMMVFNGEIFNYVELKADLEKSGYSFDTHSDTEVLIKLFHRDGIASFAKLNGMWAFAIYNRKNGEFFLCRDRFGQKPLFIARAGSSLVAASEIAALDRVVEFTPNYPAIASFLREGDFDVGGHTFFNGVFEFPKAAYLHWSRGRFEIASYWEYPDEKNPARDRDLTKEFHELLADAVAIRLRTDVDYALLLSGGCDSTLISAITREQVGPQAELHAFTYSSNDKEDESLFAESVAERLNLDLAVQTQESPSRYIGRLRRLVRNMGRGHSSPAIVSVDSLYEAMHRFGYKVALDGQGADEMLAGYRHYHFHLLADLLLKFQFREALRVLRDIGNEGFVTVAVMALRSSLPPFFRRLMRRFYGYEKLFVPETSFALGEAEFQVSRKKASQRSFLNAYLQRQHDKGLTNLLYYGDIVAMANSVENRSPFMDHRLVELAFSNGASLKVRGAVDKWVLRAHPLYERFRDVVERKKIGFSSAIHRHIRQQMRADLLSSPILKWPIFDGSSLEEFLASPRPLSAKFERFLFRLYQVHLWQELFLGAARLQPKPAIAAHGRFEEARA